MPGAEGGAAPTQNRQVRLRRVTRNHKGDFRLFAALLALVFLGFLLILRYMAGMLSPPVATSDSARTAELFYTLRMDGRDYARGQPVGLELAVKNITGHPVSMSFDTDQEFDFVVQSELNLLFVRLPREVWRWSTGRTARPKPHTITILPGRTRVFRARWNQVDAAGRQVKPGRYLISGYVNDRGERHALQIQTSR